MRLLFAASASIALPALDALLADTSAWSVVGVLTSPPARSGRGRRIDTNPIRDRAEEAGLTVLQPATLRSDARAATAELECDVLLSFAYGRIFGPKYLGLFRGGAFNVHPSLLPRHRGPTPIQGAIMAGDIETGVTVQTIALEVDAGEVLAMRRIPIDASHTVLTLERTLGTLAAELVPATMRGIATNSIKAIPQNHSDATYTELLHKSDGYIAWTEPAATIERMVRAYGRWPGVHSSLMGERVRLVEVAALRSVGSDSLPGTVLSVDRKDGILVQTSDGTLALRRLQPGSRAEMDSNAFVNGRPQLIGKRFEPLETNS